jgi:hypothetical protein
MFMVFRHQIAEEKGLTSHSFGEEGVDRYVYLYKKVFLVIFFWFFSGFLGVTMCQWLVLGVPFDGN